MVKSRKKIVTVHQIDRPLTILAMILVATVTEAMLLLLPIFIGAISDLLPLTASEVGLLGSADLTGVAIGASTGIYWLRRTNWRQTVIVSLSLFSVFNVLSMWLVNFDILLIARLLAGLCCGAAYAVALAGLCDTIKEARNTALMVCSQVVFGAVGVYALPFLEGSLRYYGVYGYMLAWTIVTLAVVFIAFPNNPKTKTKHEPLIWKSFGMAGLFAFGGTALYFLTIGAVWAYLERVAIEAGMSLTDVGTSLMLGYVISLAGSFGAAWMGVRFGRAWPMAVTGMTQIAMLVLFTQLGSFKSVIVAFFFINAVFQIFWSYIISYQIVIFSDADRDGRFMPLYGTAMHTALAIGPFAGSLMIIDNSYRPVLFFGIATLTLCYTMFLLSVFLNRRFIAHRNA